MDGVFIALDLIIFVSGQRHPKYLVIVPYNLYQMFLAFLNKQTQCYMVQNQSYTNFFFISSIDKTMRRRSTFEYIPQNL
jgi:hypothetical protein